MNPFHATGFFLYPLKTSKPKVFWCFQGVQKETMAWNGLIYLRQSWMFNPSLTGVFIFYLLEKTFGFLMYPRVYKTGTLAKMGYWVYPHQHYGYLFPWSADTVRNTGRFLKFPDFQWIPIWTKFEMFLCLKCWRVA